MHVGSKSRRADSPAREAPGYLAARVSELESRAARVTELERRVKKLKRKLKNSRSLFGHKVGREVVNACLRQLGYDGGGAGGAAAAAAAAAAAMETSESDSGSD